jgi:hypothetical protein
VDERVIPIDMCSFVEEKGTKCLHPSRLENFKYKEIKKNLFAHFGKLKLQCRRASSKFGADSL